MPDVLVITHPTKFLCICIFPAARQYAGFIVFSFVSSSMTKSSGRFRSTLDSIQHTYPELLHAWPCVRSKTRFLVGGSYFSRSLILALPEACQSQHHIGAPKTLPPPPPSSFTVLKVVYFGVKPKLLELAQDLPPPTPHHLLAYWVS